MSAETRLNLDAAIRAHAQNEWEDDLVVDWVLVAATIDADDMTGIGLANSREKMPAYITKGLLVEALDDIRDGVHDYDEADDD